MARPDKRTRLVETAMKLAYRQGFRETSLADIANDSKVPLGNVYYYFKTKDDLGEAIVARRLKQFAELRARWEKLPDAKARLCACIDDVFTNRQALARGGCPVGTLCSELHKEGGALAESASRILSEHLDWLEAQFRSFHRKGPRGLAIHLLSTLQGASVLAHIFRNPEYVTNETARLKGWVQRL